MFSFLLSFDYVAAVVIAYVCGIITAFTLDKLFVFKNSTRKAGRQAVGFLVVNLFGLAQTLIVSLLLRDYLFPAIYFDIYPDGVAHIVGVGIPMFTSFLGHKYFSF